MSILYAGRQAENNITPFASIRKLTFLFTHAIITIIRGTLAHNAKLGKREAEFI